MESIFIVNMSERAFFRYNKKNDTDLGYNKLLLELFSRPDKNSIYSHWNRDDKIIIAPKDTHNYLERYYNELYL